MQNSGERRQQNKEKRVRNQYTDQQERETEMNEIKTAMDVEAALPPEVYAIQGCSDYNEQRRTLREAMLYATTTFQRMIGRLAADADSERLEAERLLDAEMRRLGRELQQLKNKRDVLLDADGIDEAKKAVKNMRLNFVSTGTITRQHKKYIRALEAFVQQQLAGKVSDATVKKLNTATKEYAAAARPLLNKRPAGQKSKGK